MSAIVSNSEIIHYEVLGRGHPVIFLHGWAGSWRYWAPSMQTVAYGYRAYALDFWGFGDSAKNQAYYGLESQTDLLEDFIHQLGIVDKVALVGHDFGGMVAIQYALRSREKVSGLVLVNCPVSGNFNHRLISETPVGLVDWLYPTDKDRKAVSLEALKADQQAIVQSVLDFETFLVDGKLPSLTMPTLIVYGANDPLVPVPSEPHPEEFPQSMGGIVFNDSGHYPMVDEDNQFSRLLRQFLELEEGVSPRELEIKTRWKRRVR